MGLAPLDAPRAMAARALLTLLALMIGGGVLVVTLRLARRRQPVDPGKKEASTAVPLGLRYLTLMGLVVVVIGAALLGGWVFVAATMLLALLGLREIWALLGAAGTPPLRGPGWILGLGLVVHAGLGGAPALGPGIALGFGLTALCGLRCGAEPLPQRLGATLLGVIYVGLLCAFLVLLRLGPNGFGRFLFFLTVIQMADLGGLFGGMAFGRHKLAPTLSPGKTWEGALGSLALAAGGGALFAFTLPGRSPTVTALIALPLAATGLLGDLLASGLKRSVGFKDFGTTLPGHGGILDRFDSYLVSAPFAWAMFTVLDRFASAG